MLPRYAPARATSGFVSAWTEHELVVWGGRSGFDILATGGRYEPRANRWNPIATNGAPSAREGASSVWTGSELIVWGGKNASSDLGDGARYDPTLDRWTPVSTVGAPRERHDALAFWTGSEMLVVAGFQGVNQPVVYPNRLDDGALYNPVTDTWRPIERPYGVFITYAEYVSAAWTGTEVVFWGQRIEISGEDSSPGWAYAPSTQTWRKISIASSPPDHQPAAMAARDGSILVWGVNGLDRQRSAGAVYEPETDTWTSLPVVEVSPTSALLAGDELVVADTTNGWLVDPDAGTKVALPPFPNADRWTPIAWTGTETIVWRNAFDAPDEAAAARLTTCSSE